MSLKNSITLACLVTLTIAVALPESWAQTPAAQPAPAQHASQDRASQDRASQDRASQDRASQDSANDLSVIVGKSVLLDITAPVSRISLGSSEIAEATAISPTEIMVNGKTAGDTTLILWERGGGRQFYNVSVKASKAAVNERMAAMRRQLALELPGQDIHLSTENDLIYLRGTVKDLNSSQRAVQVASTMGRVANLLYVTVPPAPTQILLKVRFASIDRTLTKNLCWNLYSLGATNSVGGLGTQACSPPTISVPGGGQPATASLSNALNLSIFRPDLNIGATIQALETKGLAEVLAEPNVMAQDGKQASFLAGGEYPYPVLQGAGSGGTAGITIAFKEFGVRLNFIPTMTPRGTIRLQVAPEVSALDFTDGITISGFTVPALTVRRVKTEVELAEGQSFAIGGLLDNTETESFAKVPFLGSIPILGKLFQSMNRTKQNTELIVIVTPVIVAAIPAGSPLPELKFPVAFLPSNSNMPMTNPGPEVTGVKPLPPPPPSMPVEKLIESMQPEQPLVVESSSSTGTTSNYGGTQQQPAPAGPAPLTSAPPQ